MATPQIGIFALGETAHAYLEFSLRPNVERAAAVRAVCGMHEPRTTVGGVNLVIGFHPHVWRETAPDDIPDDVHAFTQPVTGPDGFAMPATQADVFVWVAGASYDVVFDTERAIADALSPVAALERELVGWSYRHSRDLTGFEDGTENPSLIEAADVALIPDGKPGAGGSVLLFQQWRHHLREFTAIGTEAQERVIGRTKAQSVELSEDDMPPDSHVSRSKLLDAEGNERHIFRRNVPYGTLRDHGTIFVGFACEQDRLHGMLEQMAGVGDGIRCALTRYSTPLTGAYYFVPSIASLGRFASDEDDDDAAQASEPFARSA